MTAGLVAERYVDLGPRRTVGVQAEQDLHGVMRISLWAGEFTQGDFQRHQLLLACRPVAASSLVGALTAVLAELGAQ